MVSLRGLQTTSTVSGSSASTNTTAASALTSATESTSTSTSTNAATSTVPSSNFTSVTTKKETTSSGEVITTVTSTTTTVRTSTSSASTTSSSTASHTVNSSGATNAATEGNAGSVSTTTVTTTTDNEGGSPPVTTVTTDNGVNTTTTSTTKDAATGITTVTTTTKTDSDMNGSASSSRTWTTTSGGSSASENTAATSTTSTHDSTSVAGASTSTSTGASTSTTETPATTTGASTSTTITTTTSSSAGATMEGASSSTTSTTNTGSSTGAASSTATGDKSTSSMSTSETTLNGETISSTTTTGSTTSDGSYVTKSASSSAGTSSTRTNTATSTSSTTGEAISSGTNTNSATTSTESINGVNSATSSTTKNSSTGSANGATSTTTETTTTSTSTAGSQSTTIAKTSTNNSKAGSSAIETTTSLKASSEGSAANSATGSTDRSTSKASSSSSSSSSFSSSLASWFLSNFRNDETQLLVGSRSSISTSDESHQICDGLPALVTRSNSETPNGGCPEEITALNASCTCITGFNETDSSWAFHVTTESWNSTTTTTTRAVMQTSSDELAINIIRPIWISSSLETLEIQGTGEVPAAITFINENRVATSSSLAFVRSASNSTNVSTLSIYNIDLNSVAKKNSNFVPTTVTNLTLRNCNISTLSTSFTREWSWIQYLDLSWNSISTEYVGGAELKELNMSHNALAVFPAATLNSSGLEALYIQGNDIADFNVSQDQFERIQGLSAFTADQPSSSSTCENGAWQSAHGTTFCVLGASTAAVPDSAQSGSGGGDHHSGLGLLGYWLIAGAIVVFFLLLLVIWQRRRHSRERDSSPVVSPEAIEPTTPKYNANAAFGDALNRDAASVPAGNAARAVSSNAYPGYGRSHGNSVDSEDTALGVSLASNPVLAACRLDYDKVQLGRCISRGGFGLVFVGSYGGRQVAVKKIRNERDVEREQVEQFVREISLISGLNHPRIVEFIGACWTTPAELSAVTELMERGDLRDVTRRFKRRGYRLTWEAHKTVIALHIAEALTYLHGLSPTVIHRDLKAKNVLLNADMEAKLSDFGIARERSFYDGSEHMTVGIGTSFWIAPEVLLGRDYDERADIYSFGVVLSEIDTDDYPYWNAQHPPKGKVEENEILRLVARGAKRPAFSDDCPPAILELAARCLRADPVERPSAAEIVVYLQQLAQDRNSSASFSSIMRPSGVFDFNTRSTNSSSPSRTAPANTIVNLRSSATQQTQEMTIPSSAAAAYVAGKRTKKTTTTTTTTTVASSSVGASEAPGSRASMFEALSPAHEVVSSSPQVTHQVVRTTLPSKGKRTTTTTTTTTARRAEQGSASGIGHFITNMAAGSSDGDSSGRSVGTESVPSSRSHAGLTYGGPTSPASLRANHQAALDNLNQQRELSSSSGEEERKHDSSAVNVARRGQRWLMYEDIKEL
ncbi:unnamed protein product [Phytophthora fragariaefolia]|uniref:Unnamed protein product n=1 Tax=Phytophthora fragariaefolia TaxID=1490495 RepID=A0A9W6XL69_9STRA|nr:unnamed protein product [Phytophthora fragariaefolia]